MNTAFTVIFSALVLAANALPAVWEPQLPANPDISRFEDFAAPQHEEHGVRLARATCDLLSVSTQWVTLNDSACAAHCLVMNKGFRGGRCRDGVCHCRR